MSEGENIFAFETKNLSQAELVARGEAVLDDVVKSLEQRGIVKREVRTCEGGWVHVLSAQCEQEGGGEPTVVATHEDSTTHMVSSVLVRGGVVAPDVLNAVARQVPGERVAHTNMDRENMDNLQRLFGNPKALALVRVRRDKEALGAEEGDPIPYAVGIIAQGNARVLVRADSGPWQQADDDGVAIRYSGSGILQLRIVASEDLDAATVAARMLIQRSAGDGVLTGAQAIAQYGLDNYAGQEFPNVAIVDVQLSPPLNQEFFAGT